MNDGPSINHVEPPTPVERLRLLVDGANELITRCIVRAEWQGLTPKHCIEYDTMLELAIRKLATARALVILAGGPTPADLAEGTVFHEDDEILIVEFPEVSAAEGGAS